MRTCLKACLGAWFASLSFIGAAWADDVADFYRGKQVQVIVGYGPGGGYDVYARLLARFIGKHLPGEPLAILQNMPGAGSLVAANYIYNVAPKDGTVFGMFARNMPLIAILGINPSVKFDPRKFTWLGTSSSFEEDAYIMWVRKDAKVQNIEQARVANGPPVVLGGTGEGATGNDVPVILHEALGINVKQIIGYPDSNALFLAIERGEIEGRTTDYSSVVSSRPYWLKPDSPVHALMQFARKTRYPDFPDIPTARELARTDEARTLIELAEMPYLFSRPYAAPPNVPKDRAAALQKAFMDTHADPDYLDEAKKLGLFMSPLSGDELVKVLDQISTAPADQITKLKRIYQDSKN
jgi:tripartite-type tricarboxylate transporter receptor subunit TctC